MPVLYTLKVLLILLFFLIPRASVQAQDVPVIGVKMGFLSSGIYTEPEVFGRENGLAGIVFYEHPITTWLSLEHNFGYLQRGFRNVQTLTNEEGFFVDDITARTRLGYLSYNPVLNFERYTPEYSKVFIAFGPRVEYLAHESLGTYNFPDDVFTDPLAEDLESVIWGFSLSTGLKGVDLGDGELRFSVGYHLDLTDSQERMPDISVRNNALIFTLGIGLKTR